MIFIQKYNEIVLLVHPLYDVFFKSDVKHLNYEIIDQLNNPKNKDRKKKIEQIKKTLAIYGRELKKYEKKPNTLFVLINPSLLREADILNNKYKNVDLGKVHSLVEKIFVEYKKKIHRFNLFGFKTLKNRFQTTNFDPEYGKKEFLPRSVLKNIDKEVSIVSFGEYIGRKNKNGCVNVWTKFAINHLKKEKINVSKKKLVDYNSLVLELLKSKNSMYPRVVSGSERRKFFGKHRKQRQKFGKK